MTHAVPNRRVIIVTQNASTRFGGEAIIPVHYFRILRNRGADVHLVVHERNRADLAAYFDGDLRGMAFVPDTRLLRFLNRYGKPSEGSTLQGHIVANVMALLTERLQRRSVKALIAEAPAAIVHVPTPVSPKAVSSMYGIDAPVVFGPMNGGMDFPPGYDSHRGALRRLAMAGGRLAARLANRIVPGKRHAARLLVANARTAGALPMSSGARVVTLVENGVQLDLWQAPADLPPRQDGPFRLLFVGRLVGWKAVDMTLRALAAARASGVEATLDLVGEGDARPGLEALVTELDLADRVTFHGFLPQARTARILAECDALILNSLYECGGAVVLEAMATGLPVIASAWGGPLDYLDETCGLLVHPSPRETFADRLAFAIKALASDPDLAARLGRAGRARVVAEFDWEKKVDSVVRTFEEVAAETGMAPPSASAMHAG